MRVLTFAAGIAAIAAVLWDAFETVVLPRSVTRRLRIARVYFHGSWRMWTRLAKRSATDGSRERILSVYGPLSLVGLLTVWAIGLVIGFAALHWSIGSR